MKTINKTGFVLGAGLLAMLVSSAITASGQNVTVSVTPPVVVTTPAVQTDYVYYPNYGVYYSPQRQQYFYLRDNAWVWAPTPMGVSANVVLASPGVRMDYHDSPSLHHTEILRRYPRNWAPPAGHTDNRVIYHENVHVNDHH